MRNELTPEQTLARVQRFIEAAQASTKDCTAQSRLEDIRICAAGYAEQGYTDPDSGVIAFANWNDVSRYENNKRAVVDNTLPRLCALFEKLGVAIEWSDEWTFCDDCQKAVRTSPDSYSWKRSYFQHEDGDVICCECAENNAAGILEQLEGNTSSCLTLEIDPAEHGYKLVDERFENGLYGGQSASPQLIGEALNEQDITRFLFKLDDVGQFDIKFVVYIHEDEFDKLDLPKLLGNSEGPDPVEQLKKALQTVPPVMAKTGDGIQVTTIDISNGTSSTREVSREDFIEGKAFKKG